MSDVRPFIIRVAVDLLGRHVIGGSGHIEAVSGTDRACKAESHDFDPVPIINKDIVRLYVLVNDTFLMRIPQSFADLSQQFHGPRERNSAHILQYALRD